MFGWIDGSMDGRMDGLMAGWIDGWMTPSTVKEDLLVNLAQSFENKYT